MNSQVPFVVGLDPGDPAIPEAFRRDPGTGYTATHMPRARRSISSHDVPDVGPPPDLLIRSHLTSWSGYGQVASWLGRSVEPLGVSVGYQAITADTRFGEEDPWTAARRRNGHDARKCRLHVAGPPHPHLSDTDSVFTMWETSSIAPAFADRLNTVGRVLVPCGWNAEGFRDSGVTVPISVVPLGFDPAVFRPMPFREHGPFIVGMAGRLAHGGARKGLSEGIRAFVAAFPKRRDVRLEIKVMPDDVGRLALPDDPRVAVITDPFSRAELAAWYAGLDLLFVPSKAEGFGLHTLEAMACGRPVIVAPHTGTAEFFTPDCGWELSGRWETAGDIDLYAGLGDWFVPSGDSMVEALRAAYTSPGEVRKRGAAAASRAAEFTWQRTGERLNEVLGLGGKPHAPPSRRYFDRYAGPLPDCRHAAPGFVGACNPIRCDARHGTTCGGSHATLDHCSACIYRSPAPCSTPSSTSPTWSSSS